MGTNRMTDDGKLCSLGTMTFPYHSRWHIERIDGIPGCIHGGQALYPWATARSGVFKISIYIFFMENETKDFVWHNFYSGSCYLDCFGSSLFCLASWQPLSPCWLKHHIPTDWLFLLKKPLPAWAQCSSFISRQCLWLKIVSAASEVHITPGHLFLTRCLHNAL